MDIWVVEDPHYCTMDIPNHRFIAATLLAFEGNIPEQGRVDRVQSVVHGDDLLEHVFICAFPDMEAGFQCFMGFGNLLGSTSIGDVVQGSPDSVQRVLDPMPSCDDGVSDELLLLQVRT